MVGDKLKLLEEQGLADDTIIFYFGDHGSGMPRSKGGPIFPESMSLLSFISPQNGNI